MCGIAGFVSTTPVALSLPAAMLRAVEKRGPDSREAVTWDRAFSRNGTEVANALAVARLAIRDVRPVAHQPMSNEQRDIWIAYNGEVYGWEAQARDLSQNGPPFRSHSDTEFLLRAYEAWGIDFLSRLRGMFAIAILDLRSKELWLARDRAGIKPLVYAHRDGDLAFGSTVRAILPFLRPDTRHFCAKAIDAFLVHRYVPAPQTIFEGINRLEPAHWIRMDLVSRQIERKRYWTPGVCGAQPAAALDEAITMCTTADRPLGLFLSSGVDSSILAQRLVAGGRNDIPAFTASFNGSDLDEAPLARDTATRLGLSHMTVPMPADVGSEFAAIVADLDEPFADPSAFPTWYLCRHAASYVTAALVGDGLDELLGGYKRVRKHVRGAWRRGWRIPTIPTTASLSSKGLAKWAAEACLPWEEAYSLRFSGFTPAQRRFLQPALKTAPATYWNMPAVSGRRPIEALLEIDWLNYLPDYILRKSDLCSMCHGIELRPPFLDHLWIEALSSIPVSDRHATPAKSVMRQLFPAIEPLALFSRPKRGFNPPVDQWLKGTLGERLPGLGGRLRDLTCGQLDARAIDTLCRSAERKAEQVLQLVILDESLRQLQRIA